mmetsp:Transcript_1147/g.2994  ORF Transcript_1147/g.2994 Transcript_1147/m.2994 type:complete len:250 (+) Transcript_1147:560-1309(+)
MLTVVSTGASCDITDSVMTRSPFSTCSRCTGYDRTPMTLASCGSPATASPVPRTTSSRAMGRWYCQPVWMMRCCCCAVGCWVMTSCVSTFWTSTAVSWINVDGTCTILCRTSVLTIFGMCFWISCIWGAKTCLITSAIWIWGNSASLSSMNDCGTSTTCSRASIWTTGTCFSMTCTSMAARCTTTSWYIVTGTSTGRSWFSVSGTSTIFSRAWKMYLGISFRTICVWGFGTEVMASTLTTWGTSMARSS